MIKATVKKCKRLSFNAPGLKQNGIDLIMTHSLSQNQLAQLKDCLLLAQNPTQQETARQTMAQLLGELAPDAATAEVIDALWQELLTARRSTAFWEQISDAEKEMGDRLTQDNIRLQQNYLRLMQEQ